ncbi:MAG: hypothetical protein LBF49_00685 [Puniceicoccales bacterium]|jgi:hypothetical protein|nr:hypothetical protein [Puniceicoccales bacterium]
MKQIAQELNLKATADSTFCKIFPKLCNWFGKYTLSGKFRGKELEIYTTKFPNIKQFPLRLVVKSNLGLAQPFRIVARKRPFLIGLHKIFDRDICFTNNPILDGRLLFSTDRRDLLSLILGYDEVQDQLYGIWKTRKCDGTLSINNNFIMYHEPFRLITKTTRERIKNVTNLICDVTDIIRLSRKFITPDNMG